MGASISDIELDIEDLGLQNLPTEEIVFRLTSDTMRSYLTFLHELERALWAEKISDEQANKMEFDKVEQCGDYITAVHLWARGGK